MRNFNQKFRLRDADRHIRLLYTLFLLLMLAGFAFSFFWAHSMTGLSPQGIADHYRGSDTTFGEPMSFRELAEITHFHLFTMPVVFMILIHVMYLTGASHYAESGRHMGRLRWCDPRSSVAVVDQLCLPDIRRLDVDRRYADDRQFSSDACRPAV